MPSSSRLCSSAVAANPKNKGHVHCSNDQTNKKPVNKIKHILLFKQMQTVPLLAERVNLEMSLK